MEAEDLVTSEQVNQDNVLQVAESPSEAEATYDHPVPDILSENEVVETAGIPPEAPAEEKNQPDQPETDEQNKIIQESKVNDHEEHVSVQPDNLEALEEPAPKEHDPVEDLPSYEDHIMMKNDDALQYDMPETSVQEAVTIETNQKEEHVTLKDSNKTDAEELAPFSLILDRIYGVNNPVKRTINGLLDLSSDSDSSLIAYSTGNTAVIKDFKNDGTKLLQGHSADITVMCVSNDLKVLATGDHKGLLIIWDIGSATCLKVYETGFKSLCISFDSFGKHTVTLSKQNDKNWVHFWDWNSDNSRFSTGIRIPSLVDKIQFNSYDSQEFVTYGNGVYFYRIEEIESGKLTMLSVLDDEKLLKDKIITDFCFLPVQDTSSSDSLSPLSVAATSSGDLIVFTDRALSNLSVSLTPHGKRSAIKSFKCSKKKIVTVKEVSDGTRLLIATETGALKLLDLQFKAIWVFDETSLSFSTVLINEYKKSKINDNANACFRSIMAYSTGEDTDQVIELSCIDGKLDQKTLISTLNKDIKQARILSIRETIGCILYGDTLSLVDLDSCKVLQVISKNVTAFDITIDDNFLTFGSNDNSVKFAALNGNVYEIKQEFADLSKNPVSKVLFSADASIVVTAETTGKLMIFKQNEENLWQNVASIKSHSGPLLAIIFSPDSSCLFSFWSDKTLVSYDVFSSNEENGIVTTKKGRIDIEHFPLAVTWDGPNLLVSFSNFKLRWINPTTFNTIKTAKIPDQLSNFVNLKIAHQLDYNESYLCFVTEDGDLGLNLLPLDGNPVKYQTVAAHSDLVLFQAFGDKVLTFSRSGEVFSWKTSLGSLKKVASDFVWDQYYPFMMDEESYDVWNGKRNELLPFLSQLDGGPDGEFCKRLIELFEFFQLKIQGFDKLSSRISLSKPDSKFVPVLMQSLGCYLSEIEIKSIENELEEEGKNDISIGDFVKLFVNHKPRENVQESVRKLLLRLGSNSQNAEQDLLDILQTKGKPFSSDELNHAKKSLSSALPAYKKPTFMNILESLAAPEKLE